MNSDPRRLDLADVLKAGRLAARLRRLPDAIEFVYIDDYDGPDVAITLPRAKGTVRTQSPGALPPFFSGLLPEGRRLTALRSYLKTSADDEFSLLLAVGSDTIGDVQVVSTGTAPKVERSADAPDLTIARFSELFSRVVGAEAADRIGLPGVQSKVSGQMIALPLSYKGGAHILKLNPPEFPFLVENEAFFAEAARECGLSTAETRIIHDADGSAGLLVRRFDRTAGHSLAQEDAAQALDRYPADKYRLTTEAIVVGLSKITSAPLVAALELLRQFAFAYLSCNGDAHAKNFSVVSRNSEWRVSPAYDLPSSQPYGDTTLALPIAGKDREDVGRKDFVDVGELAGVRARATEQMLDALVSRVPRWIDHLDTLPFDRRRIHRLRRAIEYRVGRLCRTKP